MVDIYYFMTYVCFLFGVLLSVITLVVLWEERVEEREEVGKGSRLLVKITTPGVCPLCV